MSPLFLSKTEYRILPNWDNSMTSGLKLNLFGDSRLNHSGFFTTPSPSPSFLLWRIWVYGGLSKEMMVHLKGMCLVSGGLLPPRPSLRCNLPHQPRLGHWLQLPMMLTVLSWLPVVYSMFSVLIARVPLSINALRHFSALLGTRNLCLVSSSSAIKRVVYEQVTST